MITDRFIRRQPGADALVEGYYLVQRRRARRVDMPVRIWFGQPTDPDTGERMDRSPRWHVELAGVLLDHEPVQIGGITFRDTTELWPACAQEPITRAEYEFRMARQDWAARYDPDDPFGSPGSKIDPFTAPLPFGD